MEMTENKLKAAAVCIGVPSMIVMGYFSHWIVPICVLLMILANDLGRAAKDEA